MSAIKFILDKSEQMLAALCVVAFAAMLGLGVLTVIFRFVIQSSLAFPDELIRYLFVWVIALGSAIGLRRNIHAAIGIFVKALPAQIRRAALVAASISTIVFLGVVVDTGISATHSALGQVSPAMQISMAWVVAAVPSGAFFGILYTVELLFAQLTTPASQLVVDDH